MATVKKTWQWWDAPVPFHENARLTMGGFPAWLIWMGLYPDAHTGVEPTVFLFL